MTADGKRKPRYGFGDIVMPTACHGSANAANLTVPSQETPAPLGPRVSTDHALLHWEADAPPARSFTGGSHRWDRGVGCARGRGALAPNPARAHIIRTDRPIMGCPRKLLNVSPKNISMARRALAPHLTQRSEERSLLIHLDRDH